MPTDVNGVFTLYQPGNPVQPGTVIDSAWANNTLDDIADALTDRLSTTGTLSSTTYVANGTVALPAVTFTSEQSSGLYKTGASTAKSFGVSVGEVAVLNFDVNAITALKPVVYDAENCGGVIYHGTDRAAAILASTGDLFHLHTWKVT